LRAHSPARAERGIGPAALTGGARSPGGQGVLPRHPDRRPVPGPTVLSRRCAVRPGC